MINNPSQIIPDIDQDIADGQASDSAVIVFIDDGVLRSVYQLLLDLAYVLFVAAITLTVSYNSEFGKEFQDYAQQPTQRGIMVALLVLGVIILAAKKIHTDFQRVNVSATSRKILSLLEDILRGIVYILLLVLVTPFALNHSEVTLLIVSYILYIVSGAFFLSIKLIKWIYFLCGGGKNNNKPWEIPNMVNAAAQVNKANQAANLIKGAPQDKARLQDVAQGAEIDPAADTARKLVPNS